MSSYILRDPDPDLWNRVKERAAREGRPLRFVILSLLKLYAINPVRRALKAVGPEPDPERHTRTPRIEVQRPRRQDVTGPRATFRARVPPDAGNPLGHHRRVYLVGRDRHARAASRRAFPTSS
jgi:hypothetical protein